MPLPPCIATTGIPVEGFSPLVGSSLIAILSGFQQQDRIERWLAKFGHRYKWNILPERGTFGVDQERE